MPSINMLPSQVNIQVKTTTNVSGGQTTSYANSYSNVPALVSDASAALRMLYAQRKIFIDHVIYIAKSVTVNTGDIVVFGTRNFFIRGKIDPTSTGRILELHCREVQPGTLIVED